MSCQILRKNTKGRQIHLSECWLRLLFHQNQTENKKSRLCIRLEECTSGHTNVLLIDWNSSMLRERIRGTTAADGSDGM
jgi:hypothetical protein